MQSERLQQLNDFLPKAEAHANECQIAAENAEALVRATRAAIAEEKRKRRHLRALPLLFPAALAAAGAAGRWAGRNSTGVAAFGAGVTLAAAAAVGVTQLSDDPPTVRRVVTAPPASSSPPAGLTPTPTKPPEGGAPPSTTPAPTPDPGQPPPRATPAPIDNAAPYTPPGKQHKPPPKTKPPHTPPGKPPKGPPDAGDPSIDNDDCRINLLGVGILCGDLFSSGQLQAWPLS